MATTALQGTPIQLSGELPAVGDTAPAYELVGLDLNTITNEENAGKKVVLNIFPSVDTSTCATSVRRFNELAASLEGVSVVNVSKDLPFALERFCGAEGIDNVIAASAFRSSFGADYGLIQQDGPLTGLLARAVVVLDENGVVKYTELVPEIADEPNYDAALDALKA